MNRRSMQNLSARMKRYSASAVDYAREQFNADLDYSPESIEPLAGILGELAGSRGVVQPDLERIWNVSLIFGAYLGEVVRLHEGGQWQASSCDGVPELTSRAGTFSTIRIVYDHLTGEDPGGLASVEEWARRKRRRRPSQATC